MTNGTIRANIKEGMNVGIVLKQDQRTGKITQGVVKRILTQFFNSSARDKSSINEWAGWKS